MEPANLSPPALPSAKHSDQGVDTQSQAFAPIARDFGRNIEKPDGLPCVPEPSLPVEDNSGEVEIEALFKQRLVGLRRLRRHERSHALQAARQWRLVALKALREERASKRRAMRAGWRSHGPALG